MLGADDQEDKYYYSRDATNAFRFMHVVVRKHQASRQDFIGPLPMESCRVSVCVKSNDDTFTGGASASLRVLTAITDERVRGATIFFL